VDDIVVDIAAELQGVRADGSCLLDGGKVGDAPDGRVE
jgi:hypothetical protein